MAGDGQQATSANVAAGRGPVAASMLLLAVLLAAALASAEGTYLLARRWPNASAPQLGTERIAAELHAHRRLGQMARARVDPTKATGLALSAAMALVIGGTVALGALAAMARRKILLARWDNAFARFGARHATPLSTALLRVVTSFGGAETVVAASLLVVVVLWRRKDRRRPSVLFVITVVAGQFALSNLIKDIVARARPDIDPLTGFSGSSFPSGHTTAATATYLALALVLGRGRSSRYKAGCAAVAAALAVSVAGTRVFLGVHWFTDVLGGLALGTGWFALASIAFGGRMLSFGAAVRQAEAIEAAGPPPPDAVQ